MSTKHTATACYELVLATHIAQVVYAVQCTDAREGSLLKILPMYRNLRAHIPMLERTVHHCACRSWIAMLRLCGSVFGSACASCTASSMLAW